MWCRNILGSWGLGTTVKHHAYGTLTLLLLIVSGHAADNQDGNPPPKQVVLLSSIIEIWGGVCDAALKVNDDGSLQNLREKALAASKRCDQLFSELESHKTMTASQQKRLWKTHLEKPFIAQERRSIATVEHFANLPRKLAEQAEAAGAPFFEMMDRNQKTLDQQIDPRLIAEARKRLEGERDDK